jgi:hypothetical protein
MVKMVLAASQTQATSVSSKSTATVQAYENLIQSLQLFVNEEQLKSMAYDNAKSYYNSVLIPFVKASILLTEAVAEACQKFTDTYQAEVDSCDLDSEVLERQINEAQIQINRLEAIWRENSLKDIPDNIKGNQLFQNGQTMERIFNMKTMLQDKLNKLLQFEASSPQLFANISNLKAIVEKGKVQTAGAWNGSSFTLPADLSWTKTVSEHWQIRTDTMKAKEKAYHEAKIKELENYNIYAWPYEDPLTKEVTIMWFIDKDGVRIFDEELQNYVEKYGKNLEGMYEIVDWEKIYELDLAARRRGDGKNYLNENQLPSGWEGYGKVGAYVDSGYWYASKTGLLDLALLVGLSFAASKSQMKANTSTNIANVMDDLDDLSKNKVNEINKEKYKINNKQLDMDLQFFAKKSDIKQIESISKKFKMSPVQRRAFGDYIESLKDLVPNNKNFSWKELEELAKEFMEDY